MHLVLYSVAEIAEIARERVLFWLHFLRNRVPLAGSSSAGGGAGGAPGYCGRPAHCPRVLLVGTHADLLPGFRRNPLLGNTLQHEFAARLLDEARAYFR